VGFGLLFALEPRTAVFGFAFAGVTCDLGGVPTIEGGDFGDSDELTSGALGCAGVS
jgi:hypothetical protein